MIGRHMDPRAFLNRVGEELAKIDPNEVKKLADMIWDVYQAGRFVYVIGNGGSGSNASHFCEDMGKGTIDRKAMGRLAKALVFICGADHPTTVALRTAAESGSARDIKAARAAFLKLKPGERKAAFAMLEG